MKKLLSFIMSIVVLMGVMSIAASAESISIKKIDSDNRNHYALLENGVLVKNVKPSGEYKSITPDTKSEMVAENVYDFYAESVALSGRLTILFNDGTLKKEKNNSEFEIVDTNVDQILDSSTYLKDNTIYSLNNKYTYENMKKLLHTEGVIYAIDNNDTLFACVNGKKIKIADDILAFNKDKLIFNKYNEILSFDLDISKGTAQLNLLTNQMSYENFCLDNFVTNDHKLISISHDKAEIIDRTNDVKSTAKYTDGYLSLDGKYMRYKTTYDSHMYVQSEGYRELYGGETFKYISKYFAIGTNNTLYQLSNIDDGRSTIDTDVDKILFYDNPIYLESIIYQKNNGEIYYYNKSKNYQNDIKYYKPFLYPLAQKQNKVVFNGKEIQLEDNIQIKDGRSMYPFRAILEAMGASVMWDGTNQKAIGTLDGNRVEFKIGTDEYIVNGEIKYMDTQSYVDSMTNKTYIPIRYVAEALGFSVDWQPGNMENRITIEN